MALKAPATKDQIRLIVMSSFSLISFFAKKYVIPDSRVPLATSVMMEKLFIA
jgi:hypothetical protein